MALSPHATALDPRRRREILDRHARLRAEGAAQTLGVAPGSDGRAIHTAFVALAKRFHPDSMEGADPELREKIQAVFIGIEEAYRTLGGRHAAHAPTRRAPPTPARPAPPAPAPSRLAPPDPQSKHARVTEALRAATSRIAERDVDGAVDLLHEVLALADDADKRRVRLLLARAYLSEPRWRRYGLGLLNEMVREAPSDPETLALLGGLYHREGLLARAEATLRRALASDPGHPEARNELRAVTAARAQGRPSEPDRPRPQRGLVSRLLSIAR